MADIVGSSKMMEWNTIMEGLKKAGLKKQRLDKRRHSADLLFCKEQFIFDDLDEAIGPKVTKTNRFR